MRGAAQAALLLTLAAPFPAAAQLATAAPKTPGTPAQTAARAEADRVIAAAQAGDVFANVTDGLVPQMRHLKSGLTCGFDPGDAGASITIYATGALPRGDDVSCTHHLREITITLYVTRYPTPMTAHEALQQSVNAMHQRFTDMALWTGTAASVTPQARPGRPPPTQPETVRIAAKLNGADVFSRSSAASCGPWIVAQRVTVPVDKALAADLAAELEMNAAVEDVCGGTKP